jgi:hypothetical protein
MVYVIVPKPGSTTASIVQPVPVELGVADGGEIEVAPVAPEPGLKPGMLVVVEGNERLRPGQEVTFQPPAADAPANNADAATPNEPAADKPAAGKLGDSDAAPATTPRRDRGQ